jgi:hypothetical protein
VEEKEVEEVKMLSNNVNEPIFNLDKCSLSELIIYCKTLLMILLPVFTKRDLDLT